MDRGRNKDEERLQKFSKLVLGFENILFEMKRTRKYGFVSF
jgi:hypothetical protein